MKNIVFCPSLNYLTDPIYLRLAKHKPANCKYVYLNTNFPVVTKQDEDPGIKKVFDVYSEIKNYDFGFLEHIIFFEKSIVRRVQNLIKFIRVYGDFKKELYEALDSLKPAMIIVASDKGILGEELYHYTKKKNIPFVVFQSAFFPERPKNNFFQNLKNSINNFFFNIVLNIPVGRSNSLMGNEFIDAHVLLWGKYHTVLLKKVKKSSYVHTIGNPEYDEIRVLGDAIAETRLKLFPVKKLKVLICTQALDSLTTKDKDLMIKAAYRQLILANPDFDFCIKVHPRENEKGYVELFKYDNPRNVIITKNTDLNELFREYHVQISNGSLTSLKALLFGLPVIIFFDDIMPWFQNFFNDIGLKANSYEELENNLNNINTYNYHESFIQNRRLFLSNVLNPNAIRNFNEFVIEKSS